MACLMCVMPTGRRCWGLTSRTNNGGVFGKAWKIRNTWHRPFPLFAVFFSSTKIIVHMFSICSQWCTEEHCVPLLIRVWNMWGKGNIFCLFGCPMSSQMWRRMWSTVIHKTISCLPHPVFVRSGWWWRFLTFTQIRKPYKPYMPWFPAALFNRPTYLTKTFFHIPISDVHVMCNSRSQPVEPPWCCQEICNKPV